jgi:hypothetical protein
MLKSAVSAEPYALKIGGRQAVCMVVDIARCSPEGFQRIVTIGRESLRKRRVQLLGFVDVGYF